MSKFDNMKKLILPLLFLFCGIGFVTAQTQVTGGTAQTLTAVHTLGDKFDWNIVGDGGTIAFTASDAGAIVNFSWPTVADIYTITVITTDANGCKSEPYIQKIQVLGDPVVAFADAGDILGVCSAATTISDNGSSDVIVTYTGAEPWVLTYSILDDANVPLIDNLEVSSLTGNYTIVVPHNFVNEEAGVKTWRVIINSAKSADDVVVNATDSDKNIVVYPKPVITNLTLN